MYCSLWKGWGKENVIRKQKVYQLGSFGRLWKFRWSNLGSEAMFRLKRKKISSGHFSMAKSGLVGTRCSAVVVNINEPHCTPSEDLIPIVSFIFWASPWDRRGWVLLPHLLVNENTRKTNAFDQSELTQSTNVYEVSDILSWQLVSEGSRWGWVFIRWHRGDLVS